VKLKDYSEFEGAALMVQKLSQLFAGVATTEEGGEPASLGVPTSGSGTPSDPSIETIEPGAIHHLTPGEKITFSSPPQATDGNYSTRTLREIAAAIGVTYEDLTGDYSQVNFSSARMSRLAHWGNVYDWQWNMLIPQFCDPAWGWAMEAAVLAGIAKAAPRAEWTPQAMPMTDPDKEARANVVRIRSGQATLSQVIREQGLDPDEVIEEIASDNAKLDAKGIWLDSDARRTSQAGLTQERVGAGGAGGSSGQAGGEEPAAKEDGAEDDSATPDSSASNEDEKPAA
jgi:lambda family phage portal protein